VEDEHAPRLRPAADEYGTVPEAIFFELIPRASTLAHP
jgi:hypothetical protein